LLLQREAEHAAAMVQPVAELQTARNGPKDMTLRHERLKLRPASML
jgi:hypothetical protein